MPFHFCAFLIHCSSLLNFASAHRTLAFPTRSLSKLIHFFAGECFSITGHSASAPMLPISAPCRYCSADSFAFSCLGNSTASRCCALLLPSHVLLYSSSAPPISAMQIRGCSILRNSAADLCHSHQRNAVAALISSVAFVRFRQRHPC